MSEIDNRTELANTTTRRQVIADAVIAFGSLAAGSSVWAKAQQAVKETPSTAANRSRTSLPQEVDF